MLPVYGDRLGLGLLEPLLKDDEVTEVMVNGPYSVYVEKGGLLRRVPVAFRDAQVLEDVIQRIIAPLGRRIDQASPFVDARLPDGSRVHAIIPPLALTGPYLTIRKFRRDVLSPERLVESGTCSRATMEFMANAVRAGCNILVTGGSGAGKTTLINVLSSFMGAYERIIVIEDTAELRLQQEHVLHLEARPANLEGKGEVNLRTLVRNALRMRPDRLIIGEVRGGEAFDLVQAFHTGHEGCLASLHANSPRDALYRLANMVLMAGEVLPYPAVLNQIATAVDLIVQMTRRPDGSRRVSAVAAVEMRQGELYISPPRSSVRLADKFRSAGLDLPAGSHGAALDQDLEVAGQSVPACCA